jgi:hypothetical protein
MSAYVRSTEADRAQKEICDQIMTILNDRAPDLGLTLPGTPSTSAKTQS